MGQHFCIVLLLLGIAVVSFTQAKPAALEGEDNGKKATKVKLDTPILYAVKVFAKGYELYKNNSKSLNLTNVLKWTLILYKDVPKVLRGVEYWLASKGWKAPASDGWVKAARRAYFLHIPGHIIFKHQTIQAIFTRKGTNNQLVNRIRLALLVNRYLSTVGVRMAVATPINPILAGRLIRDAMAGELGLVGAIGNCFLDIKANFDKEKNKTPRDLEKRMDVTGDWPTWEKDLLDINTDEDPIQEIEESVQNEVSETVDTEENKESWDDSRASLNTEESEEREYESSESQESEGSEEDISEAMPESESHVL